MKRLVSFVAVSLSLLACCLLTGGPALAATTGVGQALEIAPPIVTLTVNPGQVINTQIKLRDITKDNLLVTNEVNDFVAAGEDGTPKILLNSDPNNPFSMKNWISPLPSLDLAPQQIKTLNITINVPANASPGGHYGVIRFTGTPPHLKGQGVALSASLGALVLLTVRGQLTHNLSVKEFYVSGSGKKGSFFEAAPLSFVARLQNNGNVQEMPSGNLIIKDMFGRVTAGIAINQPPRNVLPASIRKFEGQLDKTNLGNKHLFGRYSAVLTVKYGDNNDQTLIASLAFWVIPWKLILGVVIALIVAFFGLRFLLRRYNQRIISRAQGYQRPPRATSRSKKSRRR